ncbi:hypothetical protein KAR10_02910 [bacterium]|nr:hypothetical protein [bacterium]
MRKSDLTPLEVRDGIIAAYVVISRLNQTQGNPDVGLQQPPSELCGHIKGCMAAFFWEQGFNFDNPTLDQLIETKIMTDSITQVYAMPENLQIALNEVIDFLAARSRGQSKILSSEVQTLINLPPLEENRSESPLEPVPQKQPGGNEKTAAESLAEGEAAPAEKKRREKKKKAPAEGKEKPKRRKLRQNKLTIDLSSIQIPSTYMMEEDADQASVPAPEPLSVEDTPLNREEPEPETPPANDTETVSDAELLSKLSLSWQPETEPQVSEPAAESEPAEPLTMSPEMKTWEPTLMPEPSDLPEITDSQISVQPPKEPVLEPIEEEKWGLGTEQEEIPDPETEPSPASETDLEESEMEKSEYSTPESNSAPESQTSGETDYQIPPQEPALPKKRSILLPAISTLLLSLVLGAVGSYYLFGGRKAQIIQVEINQLKAELAKTNQDLETTQTELSASQEEAQKVNEDLDLQREASLQPVVKPKFIKSGPGVVIYWLDKDVMRKYYFYRAKGRKAKLKKISDQPMSKNIMYLKKVSSGTWRYAVSAVDLDGKETELSKVLKLKFPLR